MSISYNTQQPSFTIIIATLNAESTLEQCLNSIIQQSDFDKIEVLIKDGGSIDKTIAIIKKYEKYLSYWESTDDSGIYDAWNIILPKITGKWVLFLGADDTLYDKSVISDCCYNLNEINPSIDIAYGRVRLVSKENEIIHDLGKNWEKTKNCIKHKMCIPHQGVFHKSTLFNEYGNFNTAFTISADYEFIRRVYLEKNVHYMGMIISCMRVGGISSNPKYTFTRLKEIRQINNNYGSKGPDLLWLITFTNACFRYSLFLLIGEKAGKVILDRFRKLAGLPSYWTKT